MENIKNENVKLSDIDIKQVTLKEFKNFLAETMKTYPSFLEIILKQIFDTSNNDGADDIDIVKIGTSCVTKEMNEKPNNTIPYVPYIIEIYEYPVNSNIKQWHVVYNNNGDKEPILFDTYSEACKFIEEKLIDRKPLNEIRILKEYPFNVKVGFYEDN